MSKQVIRVSDATFRAIAAKHGFVVTEPQGKEPEGFKVGGTVRITGSHYHGQVGELRVIDEEDGNGLPFGVYLDCVERVVPFGGNEVERVDMAVDEDKLPF